MLGTQPRHVRPPITERMKSWRAAHSRMLSIKLDSPVIGDDSVRSWIQIARTGSFKGHAAGPFELTTKELSEMVRNFERDGDFIPVVLGHPDTETPAYGWIHELQVRGEELWALTEWDSEIVPLIRKRRFRGCSMVFSTDSVDRESGEPIGAELYELGITNRPFLGGMQPLTCSVWGQRRPIKMAIDAKKVMEALSELPKDASPEQYHMALEGALLMQQAQEKPEAPMEEEPVEAEMTPTAEVPPPVQMSSTAGVDAHVVSAADSVSAPAAPEDKAAAAEMEIAGALGKILGTDAAGVLAFIKDNADAIAQMAKKEPASGTPSDAPDAQKAMSREAGDMKLSLLEARIAVSDKRALDLETELAAYKAKEKDALYREVDHVVDAAIETGAILPAFRDTFVKLGRMDRSAFDTEIEKFKSNKQVPTGKLVRATVATASGNDLVALDSTEELILKQLSQQPDNVKRIALTNHRNRNTALNGRA